MRRDAAGRDAARRDAGTNGTVVRTDATSDPAEQVLRAREPSDLLAVVPYLMGYQPRDSLVIGLIVDRQLHMCARLDLALVALPEVFAARVRRIATTRPSDGVVLLGFGDHDPARYGVSMAVQALTDQPEVRVIEAACTDQRRWWSLTCTGPCCPPEGQPFDPQASRIAAEAVWSGLQMASGREEIARTVLGPARDQRARLRRQSAIQQGQHRGLTLLERQHRMAELVSRFAAEVTPVGTAVVPDEDHCLELAVLASDLAVRDVAWAMMTRPRAAAHVTLWRQVVELSVPELACPVLCLLGAAAWIAGDGTLQVCCLERAETLDAGYTMVGLLSDLNEAAAPPGLWDQIGPDLRGELEATAPSLAATISAWMQAEPAPSRCLPAGLIGPES